MDKKERIFILASLELLKADLLFDRENTENPICPGCGERDNPKWIKYEIVHNSTSYIVCYGCFDQNTYNTTGCYYGQPTPCHHKNGDICDGPVKYLLFQKG